MSIVRTTGMFLSTKARGLKNLTDSSSRGCVRRRFHFSLPPSPELAKEFDRDYLFSSKPRLACLPCKQHEWVLLMQVAPVSTTGPPQFHSLTTPVHTQSGGPPIPPHYPAGSSAQNPSTDTRRGEREKHYFLSASPHGWSEVVSLHIPPKSFL